VTLILAAAFGLTVAGCLLEIRNDPGPGRAVLSWTGDEIMLKLADSSIDSLLPAHPFSLWTRGQLGFRLVQNFCDESFRARVEPLEYVFFFCFKTRSSLRTLASGKIKIHLELRSEDYWVKKYKVRD
jgi:hypothetical protein